MTNAAKTVEQVIKEQFARPFSQSDWQLFKQMSEFYIRRATSLRKKDIDAPESLKLLARNSQKRLHIGVGIELLLKAIYLRRGYQINKLADSRQPQSPTFPYTFEQAANAPLRLGDTFTFGPIIQGLLMVAPELRSEVIQKGLRIAMVFRNKEGHAVYDRHHFDASNYRDIEVCLASIYATEFNQVLRVRFSLEENEDDQWEVADRS